MWVELPGVKLWWEEPVKDLFMAILWCSMGTVMLYSSHRSHSLDHFLLWMEDTTIQDCEAPIIGGVNVPGASNQ